jgi:site-specific DNA-methyltransferase (adenine-specific)
VILLGDCLEQMKTLEPNSVDLVLCDPPYGTTACKWDSVIPFESMWTEINRVAKKNAAICIFGSEPFSSALRMSNLKKYRYDWIWIKDQGSNFFEANKKPLKNFEIVSVFYSARPKYNPQMRDAGKVWVKKDSGNNTIAHLNVKEKPVLRKSAGAKRFPLATLNFNRIRDGLHPTQKPVPLLEYLIKTYTNEGDTVLDFTMGSGSTGVAATNLKREFIGIEMDAAYFEISKKE